jgi:hypothetical protein
VGTVKSVGLSAPSSDFTVSGSPVTSSGTLGLNWNVAPTSASTANAIVKRDGTGSFSAGAITASLGLTGLSAGSAAVIGNNSSSGYGVFGSSTAGTAVWGQSSGTSGTSNGIEGVTSSATASGVAGVNSGSGIGVYGSSSSGGGVGVWGQGPGQAFYADGNVAQNRTNGGWVKAMVYASGFGSGAIAGCFNSTLSGAAATTPPCGFSIFKFNTGDYVIDLGFEVDDRFFSLTPSWYVFPGKVCTFTNGGSCPSLGSIGPNQAEITFDSYLVNPIDNKFYLIVY